MDIKSSGNKGGKKHKEESPKQKHFKFGEKNTTTSQGPEKTKRILANMKKRRMNSPKFEEWLTDSPPSL